MPLWRASVYSRLESAPKLAVTCLPAPHLTPFLGAFLPKAPSSALQLRLSCYAPLSAVSPRYTPTAAVSPARHLRSQTFYYTGYSNLAAILFTFFVSTSALLVLSKQLYGGVEQSPPVCSQVRNDSPLTPSLYTATGCLHRQRSLGHLVTWSAARKSAVRRGLPPYAPGQAYFTSARVSVLRRLFMGPLSPLFLSSVSPRAVFLPKSSPRRHFVNADRQRGPRYFRFSSSPE